jgi:uncharacterized RDD family membrane protein YckC
MEVTGAMPSNQIAGAWRRLFAFLLDGLLLGVLGFSLGLVAHDDLVALGDWGRAVGFAIALTYFSVLESRLFSGQTPGKWWVGIKVVANTGEPLSIGASTARAAIFCVPFFLNGAHINATTSGPWPLVLISFLVFGVGISILYLLLFNRRTRQSLHDLAVGAHVVMSRSSGPVDQRRPIWAVHFGVLSFILLAALVAPYYAQRLSKSEPFVELLSVQQGLQQLPEVRYATVNTDVVRFFGHSKPPPTTRSIQSRVVLSRRVKDLDSLANRLARITLERDPSAENQDKIGISIIYGYDIGIASAWESRNFSFSPGQWRNRFSTP